MRAALILAVVLTGCSAVESSGGMLPPTSPPVAPAAVAAVPAAPSNPIDAHLDGADAADDAPDDDAVAEAPKAAPDDAFAGGVSDDTDADVTGTEAASDDDASGTAAAIAAAMGRVGRPPTSDLPAAVPPSAWDPGTAGTPSWGVRLVSTLADTQPPRAVLALGEGDEVVVQPGTFVPRARLVVLAIGRDAVQVAHVEPEGDHTRVTTEILQPFYGRGQGSLQAR